MHDNTLAPVRIENSGSIFLYDEMNVRSTAVILFLLSEMDLFKIT